MFTDTEIALMNRADRDVNRITNKYQAIVDDLRGTIRIWEKNASEWEGHAVAWRDHAGKLQKRIDRAQAYLKSTGLSDEQIEIIIRG